MEVGQEKCFITAWWRTSLFRRPLKTKQDINFLSDISIRVKNQKSEKMKLSTICLAGLASATEKKVPPRYPLDRLNRLVEFSSEILQSDEFRMIDQRIVGWKFKARWEEKFRRNAGRMETNFKRCGFYDESLEHGAPNDERKRRDLDFDRYNREDPCIGMKQIITGFRKWSERYLSKCRGQKNNKHQANRLAYWSIRWNRGKG